MKNKKLLLVLSVIPLFGLGFVANTSSPVEATGERDFGGHKRKPFEYALKVENEPEYSTQKAYQFDIMRGTKQFTTNRGEGVKVAVIDTGANIYHEDFLSEDAVGKTITDSNVEEYSILSKDSASFTATDGGYSESKVKTEVGILKAFDDDTYDSEYNDYYSHGTCTASVIGAAINGVGGAGLAPEVELMVLKIDFYDTSINAAIRYAADHGADVISMSLGGYADGWTDPNGDTWPNEGADVFDDAVNYAHNKGCVVVAAAGNEYTGSHLSYPASTPHVIGVGALAKKSDSTKADYSNWNVTKNGQILANNNADVFAPGTTWMAMVDDKENSKDHYGEDNGTSFACPLTAAACALYKSAYPDASPDEIKQALYDSCDDLGTSGYDAKFGHGRVNVANLLSPTGPVEKIDLPETLEIAKGRQKTLKVEYTPYKATNKGVTWESNNTSVATVNDNGVVTAIDEGNAVITATSIDGVHKATCNVSVVKYVNTDYSFEFEGSYQDETAASSDSDIFDNLTEDSNKEIISSLTSENIFLSTSGLKFGSSKKTGSLTFTLADNYTISNIMVLSEQYGSDPGTFNLRIGSYNTTFNPANGFDGAVNVTSNEITLSTSEKRAFLQGIIITVSEGEVVNPGTGGDQGDTGGDTGNTGGDQGETGGDVTPSSQVTYIASSQGYANQEEVTSWSRNGVTLTFDAGTNTSTAPKYYDSGTSVRVYTGNTLTVSATQDISKIEITFGSSDRTNEISVNTGTLSSGVWTGSSKSVTFTVEGDTGHRRFAQLVVTLGTGSSSDNPGGDQGGTGGDTPTTPETNEITITQALQIAGALENKGSTTEKYIVGGYITSFDESMKDGNARAITISTGKVGSEGDSIMIYGIYSDNDLRQYAILNGYVKFEGILKKYYETLEMDNVSVVPNSYTDNAITYAKEAYEALNTACEVGTDAVTSTMWNELASKFNALDTYSKDKLVNANLLDKYSSDIAKWMDRYSIIVFSGKDNFMDNVSVKLAIQHSYVNNEGNIIALVAIASLLSSAAILGFVISNKKKRSAK